MSAVPSNTRRSLRVSFSVAAFVILTSSNTFAVRFSRLPPTSEPYSSSLVTFCIDVLKVLVCFVALKCADTNRSTQNPPLRFFRLRSIIPAVCFTWQTQLLLYSASYLHPTVYQTLGQLKVVTTAFFSWLMLSRRFTKRQLTSLGALAFGSWLVRYDARNEHARVDARGSFAVILASILSGFAGVHVERILKDETVSFFWLNIELASSSALLSIIQFAAFDYDSLGNMFKGFNRYTALVVLLSVASGIFTGLILRDANSIVKSFAASSSLVLTAVIDCVVRSSGSTYVYLGLLIVTLSIILYGSPRGDYPTPVTSSTCRSLGWFAFVFVFFFSLHGRTTVVSPQDCAGCQRFAISDIPIVVLSANNPTFLRDMIDQLSLYHSNLTVFDDASDFPPMLELLSELSRRMPVHKSQCRLGPRGFLLRGLGLIEELPRYFAVTDADLILNRYLPPSFLTVMYGILSNSGFSKVGFALDLSDSEKMWKYEYFNNHTIVGWESRFWNPSDQIKSEQSAPVYKAHVDTTFALYDKNKLLGEEHGYMWRWEDSLRVAGNFTAKHRPWYPTEICRLPLAERRALWSDPLRSAGSTIANILIRTDLLMGQSSSFCAT